MDWVLWIAAIAVALLLVVVLWTRWAMHWGATKEERTEPMPGTSFFTEAHPVSVVMTRAVSIDQPPDVVWPWVAQIGRGAGWHSWDRLDNGGRRSAEHIVSWIPEAAVGDAAAIGYLRHLEPGKQLAWWTPGVRFLGAHCFASFDFVVRPDGSGSRLITRIAASGRGFVATCAFMAFRLIDSMMAIRQLKQLKRRIEAFGDRAEDPERPETGDRDQFQHYETIFVSGERAGTPGTQGTETWRRAAIEAGLIEAP